MAFEIFLITLGVSLLLLGLLGKVKSKIFEAGVQKKSLRIIIGILGVLFIAAAFTFKPFPFLLNKDNKDKKKLLEPGKTLIKIKPIIAKEDDDEIIWVKNTVERKIIEILYNCGHIVKSSITEI
jgi:hypothetical protein